MGEFHYNSFDTVDHTILIEHPEICACVSRTLHWIGFILIFYLFSKTASITCGEPQGCVLGPVSDSIYFVFSQSGNLTSLCVLLMLCWWYTDTLFPETGWTWKPSSHIRYTTPSSDGTLIPSIQSEIVLFGRGIKIILLHDSLLSNQPPEIWVLLIWLTYKKSFSPVISKQKTKWDL